MPIIKSQKKRVLTNEKRRQRNVAVRTRLKSYLKKAEEAFETHDGDKIQSALKDAVSEIDIAHRKGVIHKNTAARKKSRLEKRGAAAKNA